ncbi:MAG: muconolactone Delta-isomerase family protein [Candidatus Aquicultorales bacterium]
MRFLVIDRGTIAEYQSSATPDMFMECKRWVEGQMSAGSIAMAYALAGEQASCYVFEVDSLERLDDLLMEYPLSAYSVFEIYPLSDIGRSFEKAAEVYRQVA